MIFNFNSIEYFLDIENTPKVEFWSSTLGVHDRVALLVF